MSDQETVAPAAETQTPAVELTQDTPEVVTPEADQAPVEEQSESEAEKVAKRMQKRIDKRTADFYRERAEKETLAQRIAALEARAQPQDEGTREVEPDFEQRVQQTAAQLRATEKLNEQCNTLWTKGTKEFPDFEQAVKAVAEDLPLFDRKDGATPAMQVVLEADNPAALLHYLGKNPDVTAELADLTPTQLSRRLDRIEREIAAAPKTSSAPKPLTPVKPAAVDGSLASAKSDKEWLEIRERELRERHKR